jgi:Single-strand binding protein family
MTPSERTDGHEPNQPSAFELRVWPTDDETVVFERQEDGRFRLSLTGRVDVIFPAPNSLRSPVSVDSEESGTQIPETPVQARTEQTSGATEEEKSEEGNEKFVFVGNPVRDPSYRVRKSGKRVADFILATNPAEDDPGYRRIRAFDDLAEKVRDQVRKGQTDIEATVYGPKHWISRRKTKEGWEDRDVTGYYAGFVKIPKRYRQGEAHSGQ